MLWTTGGVPCCGLLVVCRAVDYWWCAVLWTTGGVLCCGLLVVCRAVDYAAYVHTCMCRHICIMCACVHVGMCAYGHVCMC